MGDTDTQHRWILAKDRKLRLFTLFILYVAQGVPIGLFWFAVPAWMAANGASAGDVGYVLGLTALPWTLKLVNGFIMDRYTFLAMGRRRFRALRLPASARRLPIYFQPLSLARSPSMSCS